jgi:hypothetical protein
MNEITRNLTIQNYRNFLNSFKESKTIFWDDKEKRLFHSGEYGIYREELVKKWLRIVVPEKFGISSGFIITDKGSISTQCDIIIYDKDKTPKIENIDSQRFFPIETVSCIGEVKSDINTSSDLNKYLIKLSEIKKLREEVTDPLPYYRGMTGNDLSPKLNPFDNIYSFLICNKFGFKLDLDKIDYGDIEQQYKHNNVLSLEDGVINYRTVGGSTNLNMPFMGGDNLLYNYLKNDDAELPSHILSFLSSLQMALNFTALLNIDIVCYLTDKVYKKIK